jgi:hypothetical protein
MAVDIGIRVGSLLGVIGSPELLQQFQQAIAEQLEDGVAGLKYPVILKLFQTQTVPSSDVGQALSELEQIGPGLANLVAEGLLPATMDASADDKSIVSILVEYLTFAYEEHEGAWLEECERRNAKQAEGVVTVTFEDRPKPH